MRKYLVKMIWLSSKCHYCCFNYVKNITSVTKIQKKMYIFLDITKTVF